MSSLMQKRLAQRGKVPMALVAFRVELRSGFAPVAVVTTESPIVSAELARLFYIQRYALRRLHRAVVGLGATDHFLSLGLIVRKPAVSGAVVVVAIVGPHERIKGAL